jgi:putative phage-type endonuclease
VTAPAVVSPLVDRAAWLAERRKGIAASEAAAVLGLSPFAGPIDVYLSKLDLAPEPEETEPMRWGRLLEPLIAEEYAARTGRRVVAQQVFLRGYLGCPVSATLDGLTDAGHPVEFKTVGAFGSRELGEEGTDEVPDHWLCQAAIQMYLCDQPRCDFAVLVGGQRFRTFTVEFNARLVEAMAPTFSTFWESVARREPPPFGMPDRRALLALYPGAEGEVALGDDQAGAVDRWIASRELAKSAKEAADECKDEVLRIMKGASIGRLPDGRIVTRKIVEVAEQVVTRKAYMYADLRVKQPKGGDS